MYEVLCKEGVIREGHIKLRSGKHSDRYIYKEKIFENQVWLRDIAVSLKEFADPFKPDIIAGPESGGAVLAEALAKEMCVPWIELSKGEHDYDFFVALGLVDTVRGKRVAVVDDVVTTGRSLKGSIQAIQEARGEVVCALAIIKRGMEPINFGEGIPFAVLSSFELPEWDPDDEYGCPYCDWLMPLSPKP